MGFGMVLVYVPFARSNWESPYFYTHPYIEHYDPDFFLITLEFTHGMSPQYPCIGSGL